MERCAARTDVWMNATWSSKWSCKMTPTRPKLAKRPDLAESNADPSRYTDNKHDCAA